MAVKQGGVADATERLVGREARRGRGRRAVTQDEVQFRGQVKGTCDKGHRDASYEQVLP